MANIVNQEAEFGDLVRAGKKIVANINKKGEALILDHFELGSLLKDLVGKTKYGEGSVEKYAQEIGVREPSIRIAYGVAKHFRFRRELIEKKIDELKEAGKSPTWGYFREIVKPDSNPEVHGSPEKHKQHLLGKAETAGKAIAEAAEHYPNDEEVAGAAIGIQETIQEAEFTILGPSKKASKWHCSQLTNFIKTEYRCVVSKVIPVEAAILVPGSDLFRIPLATEYAAELEEIGRTKFAAKYNLDYNKILVDIWQSFISWMLK